MKRSPTLPADFNFDGYRLFNPDIKQFTDEQLKAHYLYSGKYEGRMYSTQDIPPDFNPLEYQELNPDLAAFSTTQLYCHYLNDGIVESRQYSKKLPQCIKKIENLQKTNFVKWSNIEYGNICTVSPLNTNTNIADFIDNPLTFIINDKSYKVHRTFLVNCNTDVSDKYLIYYNHDYILLAAETQYYVTGVYDVKKKILHTNKDDKIILSKIVNALKQFLALTLKYSKEFKELLQSKLQVFTTFICVKQIMHNYINEISGLQTILQQQTENQKRLLDRVYSFYEYFVKYEDLFQEVNTKNVEFIRNKTCEQIFLETCRDRLFFVKRCDLLVTQQQNNNVINICKKTNIYNVDHSRYRNRILLTIRKSFRNLQNQIDFTVNIIEFLHKKYPMSIFYIDGNTELLQSPYHLNSLRIQEEQDIYSQIQQRLSKHINLYSLLFLKFNTYVCLLQGVDLYISSIGTCQHKIGYFCSAAGLIHGGGETLFSKVNEEGFFWQKHFGDTCKPIPKEAFVYENINDYNSDYSANISEVIKFIDTSVHVTDVLI